jgi:hypothetical protein
METKMKTETKSDLKVKPPRTPTGRKDRKGKAKETNIMPMESIQKPTEFADDCNIKIDPQLETLGERIIINGDADCTGQSFTPASSFMFPFPYQPPMSIKVGPTEESSLMNSSTATPTTKPADNPFTQMYPTHPTVPWHQPSHPMFGPGGPLGFHGFPHGVANPMAYGVPSAALNAGFNVSSNGVPNAASNTVSTTNTVPYFVYWGQQQPADFDVSTLHSPHHQPHSHSDQSINIDPSLPPGPPVFANM